jgi:signal transduction histidine kinase
MVLCQLALTVFVGVWIVRQYNNAKSELKKDLSRKFAETERQVTDSVIYHTYIEPLSKDTIVINRKGPVPAPMEIMGHKAANDSVKNPKMLFITIDEKKDSVLRHPEETEIKFPDPRTINKVIVGMKMLIAHPPSDSGQLELNYQMKVEADTGLFKKIFAEKTGEMGLNMSWVKKRDLTGKKEERFYFYSAEFSNIPAVNIEGYKNYLLGRIWPQIAFGALLVLLTATAFIIAYRSIRSQQQLNTIREDFISNISHELKTPLSTAKVTIEALKTYDLQKREQVMQEYLDIAGKELERLDELVTKVLHTGMPGNGNRYVQPKPVELNGLVSEVVHAFRARTKEKEAKIHFMPGPPLSLELDALHIYGVLYNLLDNAVKYSQRSDTDIKVYIEQHKNEVLVHVSDNGPGIHADYLPKVFDKFFRVPSGNVHNIKGHGLGLSYSQQVMQQHGGRLTVKNNAGEGCTFTLHFPLS